MVNETHVELLIEYRQGHPLKEPVHVRELYQGTFQLLYSPGFVQGIAAGDTFRLLNDDGAFEVTSRGKNLAIQVFSNDPVAALQQELAGKVVQLGGTLDGAIERGLVFTMPVSAGFGTIEKLFNTWTDEHPGWEWYYGNVYDTDGTTPLGWWN